MQGYVFYSLILKFLNDTCHICLKARPKFRNNEYNVFLTWIKNLKIFPQRFIFNFKRNAEERKQFYRTSHLSIPFMVFKYTDIILQHHPTPQGILMSLNKFDVRSCPNGWLKWSSLFWEWQRNVLPRMFHKAHLSTHPRTCLSTELCLLCFISCFCFSSSTDSIPVELRFGYVPF